MAATPDVSQSAAPKWISLPLAKFSYATSMSEEYVAHDDWVHHPERDNLFAIFDTVPTRLSGIQYEERRWLKVVCGSNILENVDLTEKVQENMVVENRYGASQLQTFQLPISTIVQSPCIAIRYKTEKGQIHRFQLRCTAEADYNTAIDILKHAGLTLKEAVPQRSTAVALGRPIRPASSSSQARPSSSASQTRLVTSRGTHAAISSLEASQDHHNIEATDPRFDVPGYRQFSNAAYSNKPSRSMTTYGPVAEPRRTLSTTFGLSASRHQYAFAGVQEGSPPFPSAYSSSSAHKIQSDRLTERPYSSSGLSQGTTAYRANSSMPPPTERPETPITLYHLGHAETEDSLRPESSIVQRPATAPMSQGETLTQLLPPKRELPFGKSLSKPASGSTNSKVTLRSSILDMPPLPTPTIVSNAKTASTTARSSIKKKAPASPSPKSSYSRGNNRAGPDIVLAQRSEKPPVSEGPRKKPRQSLRSDPMTGLVPQEPNSAEGVSPHPLTNLETSALNSHESGLNRPLQESDTRTSPTMIQAVPSPLTTTLSGPNPTTPVNPTNEEWTSHVDAFVGRHAGRPPPMQAQDLSTYAAQSDEDRAAQIDNMICDLIMDDNFLKLREDVENSWRRIALGY
ncbi:MAG: hypothetical protein M1812_006488 [Candelaria pacifica]|nr:MAG: hypothetical protein M1812_006488 [Candelaria pacifica]